MLLELAEPESDFLRMLLLKELEETRVELHHARNMDFKAGLEAREGLLRGLIGRIGRNA
ncbi:MAG TPA: hypothetical protein VK188_04330 [Holophaga sp.]|nr:hypothetical protein [Holophaga sp.]